MVKVVAIPNLLAFYLEIGAGVLILWPQFDLEDLGVELRNVPPKDLV